MEWYKINNDDVIKKIKSDINGLTSSEVKKRQERDGLNVLPKEEKDGPIKIFLSEFKDPIIWLLLVAIIFSFIVNEYMDGFAILFIVLIDAILGTVQEWKASKSAEALENLITVKVKVLRDNKEQEVESSDLVIGDIVLLEPGNKVSADMRIIESRNLSIDESILTGESINSSKFSEIINEKVVLAERKNMLYAGTNVITGRGIAVVVEVAANTEIGKIADKVSNEPVAKSPLTIRMDKFSKQISIMIVIIAIIIAILLYINGNSFEDIFLSVIALSVSAMPEGLPLALTMALTIGSSRMVKRNVIVKKLNSVESLGSCTVIASDKTGTLTVNEQTAKKIILPSNEVFDIEGTGYNDDGKIVSNSNKNTDEINEIAFCGFANNEASLEKKKNKWVSFGDSVDVAFISLAYKAGIKKKPEVLANIPYESENKYSAAFFEKNGKKYCTVKGSLEKVFEFCDHMYLNGKKVKIDKDLIMKQNEGQASNGYRLIAVACGESKNFKEKDIYNEKDIEKLTFLGLVAFIDPIRKETISSIKDCKTAGINVVMVTGDHPLTAFAIAKQLGIVKDYNEVATSDDVEKHHNKGHEKFIEYIKNKKVFSRVTPIQKLEIVNAFKDNGEFIAVTGDGVNDAPAIRAANIGIAMGSGTDVAKETASMIIIDDNFLSIVDGIKEGRNAYSNIRKISYFLLSCGYAEVLFFVLATIFKMEMPLLAIQLLWLNVVTNGLQDLALSFEKETDHIMKERPRNTKESVFNKTLISELLIAGTLIGAVVFAVWYYLINVINMDVEHARGYIMALMVFMQNIHVLNCRSEKESLFKISLKTNPFIVISILSSILLQIIVMEVDGLSRILSTYKVPFMHMIYLLMLSTPILLVMELYKIYKRKNAKKN